MAGESQQEAQTACEPSERASIGFAHAPVVGVDLLTGFFSVAVGLHRASSSPVRTHQYMASAMIKIRQSRRLGDSRWVSSRRKPRLLKSENIGSMLQRAP